MVCRVERRDSHPLGESEVRGKLLQTLQGGARVYLGRIDRKLVEVVTGF